MVLWRTAAAVAVFVVAASVLGSANGVLGIVDDTAAIVSLGLLSIAVIAGVVLGSRSRRLSTPYW